MSFCRSICLLLGFVVVMSHSQAEAARDYRPSSSVSKAVSLKNADNLIKKMMSINTLSATITTTHPASLSDQDETTSSGCLMVSRANHNQPTQFKWLTGEKSCQITSYAKLDDSDELVISFNGKTYWRYNVGLEVAKENKINYDKMLMLKLLVSPDLTAKELVKDFQVTVVSQAKDKIRFTLKPSASSANDAQFAQVDITFDSGVPDKFTFIDLAQHKSDIVLKPVVVNKHLASNLFTFNPKNLGSDVDVEPLPSQPGAGNNSL